MTRSQARVRATTSRDTTYSRRIEADFVGPSDRVSPVMPGADSRKIKARRRRRRIPTLLGLLIALVILGLGAFTLLRAAGVDLGAWAHRLGERVPLQREASPSQSSLTPADPDPTTVQDAAAVASRPASSVTPARPEADDPTGPGTR